MFVMILSVTISNYNRASAVFVTTL